MPTPQLDALVVFQHVAQARSFTAAAARLDVSPQAVSQTVKALERQLGVRLFHRTTRSVSLNEAGERLQTRIGPALTDLFEALESVQELRDRPTGLLRLGVSRPAFHALLLPSLREFHEAYPDIQLELSFDDGFVDIAAQQLDAGIRLGDGVAQDMVSVKISESEPIGIFGAPDYLKRRGVPRRVADLAQHDCIRFRFPGSGTVFRWELLDQGNALEMEVNGPVIVNDAASMVSCAIEGLGLAYALERTARDAVQRGQLQRVLASASPALPGFHLYFPSRRQLPLKLRCFVDFMTARLHAKKPRRARTGGSGS